MVFLKLLATWCDIVANNMYQIAITKRQLKMVFNTNGLSEF
jgi:hypothetical protein